MDYHKLLNTIFERGVETHTFTCSMAHDTQLYSYFNEIDECSSEPAPICEPFSSFTDPTRDYA
jgi:hypothetical protein